MEDAVKFHEGCFCLHCGSNNLTLETHEDTYCQLTPKGIPMIEEENIYNHRIVCNDCGEKFNVVGTAFKGFKPTDALNDLLTSVVNDYTYNKRLDTISRKSISPFYG